jgi:hypothetical protein
MRGSLPPSSTDMPPQYSAPGLEQVKFLTAAASGVPAVTGASAGRFGTVRRRRLEEAVSGAVRSGRTTVVSAPAGYGKTILLRDWSRSRDEVCAWLTVGRSADDPGGLYRGIVLALQGVAAGLHGPARGAVLGLDPRPGRSPP